jgi:hypothetical protein
MVTRRTETHHAHPSRAYHSLQRYANQRTRSHRVQDSRVHRLATQNKRATHPTAARNGVAGGRRQASVPVEETQRRREERRAAAEGVMGFGLGLGDRGIFNYLSSSWKTLLRKLFLFWQLYISTFTSGRLHICHFC